MEVIKYIRIGIGSKVSTGLNSFFFHMYVTHFLVGVSSGSQVICNSCVITTVVSSIFQIITGSDLF